MYRHLTSALVVIIFADGMNVSEAQVIRSHSRLSQSRENVHSRAANPIFSFQGEDTETAISTSPQNCSRKEDKIECTYFSAGGGLTSTPQTIVAGISMKFVMKDYNSQTGRLYYVYASMGSGGYAAVVSAFAEKYGDPAETQTRKWQSKGGAVFDNTVSIWHFKGGDLEADSMGLDINSASFEFTSTLNAPAGSKPKVDF